MKKYKIIRMPLTAFLRDKQRLETIRQKVSKITGKPSRIKMTQFYSFRSEKPIYIYDEELLDFFGKRRKKSNGRFVI